MVMTTDDNSGFWSSNDFFAVDEDWGDLSLDIDALNAILEEDSDPTTEQSQLVLQSNPEDLSCHSFQAEQTKGDVRDSQSQNGIRESEELFPVGPVLPDSSLWCPSECLQPSFPTTGVNSECLSGSPDFGGMIFDYGKFDSPVHSCSASLTDWLQTSHTEHDIWSGEKIGSSTLYSNIDGKKILQRTPNCPVLSFSPVDANQAPNCIDYMSLSHVKNENSTEFGHVEGDLHFRCPSQFTKMEDSGASPSEFALMDAHISLTNPPHSDVGDDQVSGIKYEAGSFLPASFCGLPSVISDNGTFGDPSADADDGFLTDDASRRSFSSIQSSSLTKKKVESVEGGRLSKLYALAGVIDKASKGFCSPVGITSPCSGVSDGPSAYHASSLLSSGVQSSTSSKRKTIIITDEECSPLFPPRSMVSHFVKFADKVIQGSTSTTKISIDDDDDDADICILEDISDPIHPSPYIVHGKSLVTAHQPGFSDSFHSGMEGTRLKVNDERLTFRAAMQDLSQPKSESSLPDGCLAVPLLRHQRIALSWMVQKETASLHCSGGILADDQGLGKTISTIALILKERSPSYNLSTMAIKEEESQALNLDDDEGFLDHDGTKQDGISGHVTVRKNLKKSESGFVLAKGRPAAGTLVVCPTSVLRQWAEELQTKVKEEANLSVLVYHGSNRTKDPCELAKYDVVITTYSIVSMEVPKQPLVDKDDEEKRKQQSDGLSSMGLSSSRKRKYPTSEKKKRKNKKGLDSTLLEAGARPLARVGWFRVVLDEAQSIKNYRTQVARACWGLRAKRRWCLSGTPIQNSIDDLYSYFRFLRYDPYAVYTSFCSTIKIPISKNPTSGYRKLQAILKTIMLRRTKATVIDGEPIINLPPKTIKLKKVNFSDEERDFYSQLEADSRAQFKVYAAAGTVKQNYVNILLMLLRLRQACDHPLLVKGYDSSSVWSSSLEVAKKLPREKQMDLLNCLEGFLAICGICNDPPEDAVVTICGHVFCNQCICERLSGDDTLCPSAQCRVQLSVTSVFSKATLRHSLSDQPGHDSSVGKFDPQLAGALEPSSTGVSDSSKIKAAIEVLKALSEPGNRPLKDSSLKSGNLVVSDSHIGESCKDMAGEKVVDVEKCRKDSITKAPEKAIVFSQWTRMLDLLEARLKSSGIHYRRLDGTMSVLARDKAVKDFNTLPEVTVIIMSLKAASLGLNMVAACHVLLLDLWWNPTTEDQAVDRAHRIGQTRPVSVLRLTVKDTVEDRILALQEKKRQMVSSAFGEDEDGGRQTRLTVDDLEYLFMA